MVAYTKYLRRILYFSVRYFSALVIMPRCVCGFINTCLVMFVDLRRNLICITFAASVIDIGDGSPNFGIVLNSLGVVAPTGAGFASILPSRFCALRSLSAAEKQQTNPLFGGEPALSVGCPTNGQSKSSNWPIFRAF